jgi:hypothetical protein
MRAFQILLLFFLLLDLKQDSIAQDIVKVVSLNEITIQAVADDFDTDAFIETVKSDSTFYLAFKAMNYYPSIYHGWLKAFKKGEVEKGYVIRKAERIRSGDWMWVELLEEEEKGKIRKRNGDYKYITAEAWDEVFFPQKKRKVNMNMHKDFDKYKSLSKSEKHRMEVKQLMFNPGNEVDGIPIIGKKMGIFEEDMHQYYEYSVYTDMYKDTVTCLVFEAIALPEFQKGKTVIKTLTTYFDQETLEVMQRQVLLSYSSMLIDFEIYIDVKNQKLNGVLLPEMIYYKGFFDVPFMKKERVEFRLDEFNYQF